MMDVITVVHSEKAFEDYQRLLSELDRHEPDAVNPIMVDNRVNNRGFAIACNLGARESKTEVIGFLNPDAKVDGPFVYKVEQTLKDPTVVITGCRFGKPQKELSGWGVVDWVCGAAMFVRGSWWHKVGGFDEDFIWSWEETDLIRRAQLQGYRCQSIVLPIDHASPTENTVDEANYKNHHFQRGASIFKRKWLSG